MDRECRYALFETENKQLKFSVLLSIFRFESFARKAALDVLADASTPADASFPDQDVQPLNIVIEI
jgi:hypothetical protein